jgi:hypothetical protein
MDSRSSDASVNTNSTKIACRTASLMPQWQGLSLDYPGSTMSRSSKCFSCFFSVTVSHIRPFSLSRLLLMPHSLRDGFSTGTLYSIGFFFLPSLRRCLLFLCHTASKPAHWHDTPGWNMDWRFVLSTRSLYRQCLLVIASARDL